MFGRSAQLAIDTTLVSQLHVARSTRSDLRLTLLRHVWRKARFDSPFFVTRFSRSALWVRTPVDLRCVGHCQCGSDSYCLCAWSLADLRCVHMCSLGSRIPLEAGVVSLVSVLGPICRRLVSPCRRSTVVFRTACYLNSAVEVLAHWLSPS